MERQVDLLQWTERLNEWKKTQFEEWVAHPYWTSPQSEQDSSAIRWRGANAFQDYVLIESVAVPSVVLGRHLQSSGMPLQMPLELVEMLNKNGIRRIIVGHTPHGNCPTVIHNAVPTGGSGSASSATCGVELIMADTSYSDMSADDNRGVAVSEVIVDKTGNQAHVHGIIQTGEHIEYSLLLGATSGTDLYIGNLVAYEGKEWFVKAKFKGRDDYLLSRVWDGFKVDYRTVTKAELL